MSMIKGKAYRDYWAIRTAIVEAVKKNDSETLERYAEEHPEIFNSLVAQAKNSTKKKRRNVGRWS